MGLMIREVMDRGKDTLGNRTTEEGGWLLPHAIAKIGQSTRPCIARNGDYYNGVSTVWKRGRKKFSRAAFYHFLLLSA